MRPSTHGHSSSPSIVVRTRRICLPLTDPLLGGCRQVRLGSSRRRSNGWHRSTLTELGQVLTRRSQVPIAQFPSAGPHRVQGIPKIWLPCYKHAPLLLSDTCKEIST